MILFSRLLVMLRLLIIITQVDLVNSYKLITKKMEWYMGKFFFFNEIVHIQYIFYNLFT